MIHDHVLVRTQGFLKQGPPACMAVVPVAELQLQLGPLPVAVGIIQMMCCSVVFATVWVPCFPYSRNYR